MTIKTAIEMREAAAEIIKNFVEAVELRTNKRIVIPRAHGSLTGLAYANAIRALPVASPPPAVERVRHVKRGTTYQVIGEAKLQTFGSIAEGAMLTIYRGDNTGALWARPTDEFRDGRFVTLSEAVPTDTERKLALAVEALKAARDNFANMIYHTNLNMAKASATEFSEELTAALAAIEGKEPQV